MFKLFGKLFSSIPIVGRLSKPLVNGWIKEAMPAATMGIVSAVEKGTMTLGAGMEGIGEFYKMNNGR